VFAPVAAERGLSFVLELADPPRNVITKPVLDLPLRLPIDFVWRLNDTRPAFLQVIEVLSSSLRSF
jgi:hypothetical protein